MSRRGEDVAATGGRTKKGKDFYPEEDEQCCRSFMCILVVTGMILKRLECSVKEIR
jgi:hypothetical protein